MGEVAAWPMELADPLRTQLQQLLQRVRAVVPQVERITCERRDPSADRIASHHDSGFLSGSAAMQGSLVLPVERPGWPTCLVGFHAREAGAFSAAQRASLELLAEWIALTVHNHFADQAALLAATQVAHNFAALRDFETGHHLNRVAHLTRLIAERVAERYGLSGNDVELISRFSRLHDIGKIGIPDAILLKQGPLTDEERRVMNTHVQLGLEVISHVLGQHALRDLPGAQVLCNVIHHHHERLDGSGYPQGLRGAAISNEGRIVAVADVFDAVVSRRPYRASCSISRGLELLNTLADQGQLDHACVAVLNGEQDVLRRIMAGEVDGPEPSR